MDDELLFESSSKEVQFEFIALKTGRYDICFDNQRGKIGSKRISFSFDASDDLRKSAALHPSSYVLFELFFCFVLFCFVCFGS